MGRLQETAQWVQCDGCLGWILQQCDSGADNSYSGQFICKLCKPLPTALDKVCELPTNNVLDLRNICNSFLKEIQKADKMYKANVEAETRNQRLSGVWPSERRKRLTASRFGKICKIRGAVGKIRIAKELAEPKNISFLAS